MYIRSSAFKEGGIIPSLYTCEGKNINPPLDIHEIPEHTKSLTLIMDDPDVPLHIRSDQLFVHWIVFNIPPSTQKILAHSVPLGLQGKNSSGKNEYTGPCPPDREHRYFFKCYAIDCLLDLHAGATKQEIEAAIKGHILAACELIGRYEKGKGY